MRALSAALLSATSIACSSADTNLKVVSFNVLCSACGGGEGFDPWETRLIYMHDIFVRHAPDLIGLQEIAFAREVDELAHFNRDYTPIFFHPNEDESYADATIFYRTSSFDLASSGYFWLSPTPDVAFSIGFSGGMQLPRLVAYAELHDRDSNRDLTFLTTHFDNNPPSQDKSAPLVVERVAQFSSPVILTGDFNSQPSDPAYQTLAASLENAYDLAETHHGDDAIYRPEDRIDHIFLTGGNWTCPEWTVDLEKYGEPKRFPSDHRAIGATLKLGEGN